MTLKNFIGMIICTFFIFAFSSTDAFAEIIIFDDEYEIQQITSDLVQPTSFTFVDDYLLVTLKSGTILQVYEDGRINEKIFLDIPTFIPTPNEQNTSYGEAGLLGITATEKHVFVFHTEPKTENCDTTKEEYWPSENCDVKNLVVEYLISQDELINPKIIKELPVCSINHHGGAITKNSNGDIYFVTGDSNVPCVYSEPGSIFKYSAMYDVPENDTESLLDIVICRIHSIFPQIEYISDVNCIDVELLGKKIRNSFGLAVDPKTGFLWQTENGTDMYDEINLIQPYFSSGWEPTVPAHGKWVKEDFFKFNYADPKFLWEQSIGITGIEFPPLNTFEKYSDYVFVGDYNNGNVYKLQLNSNRDGFYFNDISLQDNIINTESFPSTTSDTIPVESKEIFFVKGIPGGIVDITFHEYDMYILSFGKPYAPFNSPGAIYKISPIFEE